MKKKLDIQIRELRKRIDAIKKYNVGMPPLEHGIHKNLQLFLLGVINNLNMSNNAYD